MESTETTNTGPTRGGGIQAMADGQLRAGDRQCRVCKGMGGGHIVDFERTHWEQCNHCQGTGVEPSGALPSSASVLPPPVPCSDARRAARSMTEHEEFLVLAYQCEEAAKESSPYYTEQGNEELRRLRWEVLLFAARAMARELMKRAEGGGNTDAEERRNGPQA